MQSTDTVGPVAEGDVFTYGHLYELPNLAVGQPVSAGEQVAISGNTGCSTSPHLHVGWVTAGGCANRYDLWRWILDAASPESSGGEASEGEVDEPSEQQLSPSSQPKPSSQPTQNLCIVDPDAIVKSLDDVSRLSVSTIRRMDPLTEARGRPRGHTAPRLSSNVVPAP